MILIPPSIQPSSSLFSSSHRAPTLLQFIPTLPFRLPLPYLLLFPLTRCSFLSHPPHVLLPISISFLSFSFHPSSSTPPSSFPMSYLPLPSVSPPHVLPPTLLLPPSLPAQVLISFSSSRPVPTRAEKDTQALRKCARRS